MAECFADGECVVAKDGQEGKNIDQYLEHMREIVMGFDYEELLSRK